MARDPGLLGLPDAVLVQICSQFCPHCAGEDCVGGFELPERFWGPEYFGTLAALAKVNVRVARLAQLVRLHVACGRRDGWGYSVSRLVRTLLEAPALAKHIRIVRLGHRDGDQQWVGDWRLSPRQVETLVALGFPAADGQGERAALAKFKAFAQPEDTLFFRHEQGVMSDYCLEKACPGSASYAAKFFPVARFNAFVLFKLAKNITAVAVLSEWPFAVFPAVKPAPRIQVKGATPQVPTDIVDPGRLPQVVELRLDTESPYLGPNGGQPGKGYVEIGSLARPEFYRVDLGKIVGLLARVPNLRTLRLSGVDDPPGACSIFKQVAVTGSTLANLTTLDLVAISRDALLDIIRCCSPLRLRHVSFQIPHGEDGRIRPGRDPRGSMLVAMLAEFDLAENLRTLRIDTSHNSLFIASESHEEIWDEGFQTIGSLREIASLRHLSISADNIYFPSLYPRVLLRDKNTDGTNHKDGERLLNLLPPSIETLEITGIYAIHVKDMRRLARACGDDDHYNDDDDDSEDEETGMSGGPLFRTPGDFATTTASPAVAVDFNHNNHNNTDSDMDTDTDTSSTSTSSDQRRHFRFPNIKRVTLRAGGIIESDSPGRIPWPFPGVDRYPEDSDDDDGATLSDETREQWEQLAERAPVKGAEYDREIRDLFAARGVEYEFDEPEFYFGEYTADYTQSSRGFH